MGPWLTKITSPNLPPKTNMSPENGWLEDGSFPFSKMVPFQRTNSFIFVGYLVPKSQISMLLPISQPICAVAFQHLRQPEQLDQLIKLRPLTLVFRRTSTTSSNLMGMQSLKVSVWGGLVDGDEVIVTVIMW